MDLFYVLRYCTELYISILAEANDFSPSSEAHSASCPMDNVGPFPRGKARQRSETDHLPLSSVEIKND
jgi:hypothetical protein